MKEKTYVEDIDRSMYDFRNEEKDAYRVDEGLTPAIVAKISEEKNDPVWMQNFRLHSLQIYNEMKVPDWGPSIEGECKMVRCAGRHQRYVREAWNSPGRKKISGRCGRAV